MRNTKLTTTNREPFTRYVIIATLLAILGGVGVIAWQSYDIATAPTREVQEGLREALEDYYRATEELRRLQEEGDGR
jgi:hypothetical protein